MRSRWSPREARAARALATIAAAMAVVSACAGGPVAAWGGGQPGRSQPSTETTGCHAYARQKTEQEYEILRSSGPAIDYSRTVGYDRQVNRYDADRRQRQLYDACMTQYGSRPSGAEPPKEVEGKAP